MKNKVPPNIFPGATLRLMHFGQGQVLRVVTHSDTREMAVEVLTACGEHLHLSLSYTGRCL